MKRRDTLILAALIAVVAILFLPPNVFKTDASSGVYADLYVQDVKGAVSKVEGKTSWPSLSSLTVGDQQIYDSGTGLAGAVMVDLHVNPVVAAGSPTSWSVTVTTKIKVDGAERDRTVLTKTGAGAPPADILVGRTSRGGLALATDFGPVPATPTTHTVTFDVDASMTINFREGNPWTATYTKPGIASASVKYSADSGAFTFSVAATSTAGSAGAAAPGVCSPSSGAGVFEVKHKTYTGWVMSWTGGWTKMSSGTLCYTTQATQVVFAMVGPDPLYWDGYYGAVTKPVANPGANNVVIVDQWFFPVSATSMQAGDMPYP